MSKARQWNRWVSVGTYDLTRLAWIARKNGMQIVDAFKPDMHFYNEIALWGTPEQMAAVSKAWRVGKHEVLNRKPPGAFGLSSVKRSEWVEHSLPPVSDKPQGSSWDEERCAEAAGGDVG